MWCGVWVPVRDVRARAGRLSGEEGHDAEGYERGSEGWPEEAGFGVLRVGRQHLGWEGTMTVDSVCPCPRSQPPPPAVGLPDGDDQDCCGVVPLVFVEHGVDLGEGRSPRSVPRW